MSHRDRVIPMPDQKPFIDRLKAPIYSFALGVGAAIGGERVFDYIRDRCEAYKETEMEALADKIMKKYRESDELE